VALPNRCRQRNNGGEAAKKRILTKKSHTLGWYLVFRVADAGVAVAVRMTANPENARLGAEPAGK
jgi:hypothetical protein